MAWSWLLSLINLSKAYPEILLSIACFLFFSYHINRRQKIAEDLPVLGMLPNLLSHMHHFHDFVVEVLSTWNWTFMFRGPWLIGMDILITCDPANVNHVFLTNSSKYPKGKEFAEMFDIFGDSLLNTDGEAWQVQRKLIHSLLSNPSLVSYQLKAIRDKVEKVFIPLLFGIAEQKKVVDLQDLLSRLTLDTGCKLILGVDPGSLAPDFPVVPFAHALEDAEEAIFYRHVVPKIWWKTLRWLRVGKEKKLATAHKVMDDFATNAITKRKENKKDGEDDEEAAVDLLIVHMNYQQTERGNKNTIEFDKFIKDNALNLILAGRDTTAATLTWFFWLLSTHPDVEQKILQELKENWPRTADKDRNTNTSFDREGLRKLVYLHAALCECLRLYPPVSLQHKGVAEADTLPSGEQVHPGTILLFHIYSMGRMEGIWGKDCMEFKPDRWITDSGKLRYEPAYKFFAFNCGPRICLGKDMAFSQMMTVVAALLYNFRFEVVQGHVVEPKLGIILHMKHGLMVKVSKREKSW